MCLCLKQVSTLQSAQSAGDRKGLQAQIAQLAAGTIDLAEGQAISAASLVKAHKKTSMLAAIFQKQQECIQVCIQHFLTSAIGSNICELTTQEAQQQWPQVLWLRITFSMSVTQSSCYALSRRRQGMLLRCHVCLCRVWQRTQVRSSRLWCNCRKGRSWHATTRSSNCAQL